MKTLFIQAFDGEVAFTLYASQPVGEPFDLVVSEILMVRGNGDILCNTIRDDATRPQPAFLFVTDSEDESQKLALGGAPYFAGIYQKSGRDILSDAIDTSYRLRPVKKHALGAGGASSGGGEVRPPLPTSVCGAAAGDGTMGADLITRGK